jgi:hypothetical protein
VLPFAAKGGTALAGLLDGLLDLIRSGLTSERLPDPPPTPPGPRAARPSRFRTLLARETLPAPAPEPVRSGGASLLALLVARETLPLDPERPRTHRNWLAFLFAPERLDPPGGTGPEVH